LIVFHGSIIALFVGRRRFRRTSPHGSLLLRAYHVISRAVRNRWTIGKQLDKKHLLDYAKDVVTSDNEQNASMSDKNDHNRFVDDLKQAIHVCRVFALYPFYAVCYNQLIGNLTSQAAQMNVGKYDALSMSRLRQ
jgi:proton-dependent oligopeptide transporter, POT family